MSDKIIPSRAKTRLLQPTFPLSILHTYSIQLKYVFVSVSEDSREYLVLPSKEQAGQVETLLFLTSWCGLHGAPLNRCAPSVAQIYSANQRARPLEIFRLHVLLF
jgi:hypothetical protein